MVVLVDEEVYLLIDFVAFADEEVQLLHGTVFGVELLLDALWQQVGVDIAEVVEAGEAVGVESLAIVAQLAHDAGEVEVEH